MERLGRLDVANGYIELLQELGNVKEQCLSNLGKDDSAVLHAYRGLQSLSLRLGPLQDAAELAAPNLVDYVKSTTSDLRQRIEKGFAAQLETVLKKINWPTPGATVPESLYNDFQSSTSKLLDLQLPDVEALESSKASNQQPLVLLPFKVMVQPLELGFRYHFEGDKPTNRLDHPEYWLSHITDKLLGQYADFIQDYIQPILFQQFRNSSIALDPSYIDATSAFITSLLPMVRTKVFATLPKIQSQPQLLSHLIHEITAFDETLRNDWSYSGAEPANEKWKGLTWEVLTTGQWFTRWLSIEKDFALARYREIVDAPDSFELDYDSVGTARKTVPTKAAIRVNDLLETVTEHYRTLASFSQKLRFLIDIQIAIFDQFHERLFDALTSFVARTTLVGRTSREEQEKLLGLPGLENLAKINGSAEYLEKAMRDWSDDIFFLELWEELQFRVQQREDGNITRDLSLSQVASKTSSTITNGNGDEEIQGALFDETATAYGTLRDKVEKQIIDLVNNNIRKSLSAYERINPWASLSSPSAIAGQGLAPTAELDALLATLNAHFGFLAKVLAPVPLTRVTRTVVQTIDHQVFEQVVLRHSFSTSGAAQLAADLAAVKVVLNKHVGGSVAETGFARLDEVVMMLQIPVRGSRGARQEDEEEGEKKLGLWEVEKKLFQSGGEEARGYLVEEMGVERLSVADARKVLARKVELGS